MKKQAWTIALAAGILIMSGCDKSDTTSGVEPQSITEANSTMEADVSMSVPEINWLNAGAMINAAPNTAEGAVATPLGASLPVSQIDTCNLVDGISFSGDDSHSIQRGEVPQGLKRFSIVQGYGKNFIMFPDGSFLGEGDMISEGLGSSVKGFPESMLFSDSKFNSLDFNQLPQFIANGFMNVQHWGIDQQRETNGDATVIYDEVGRHKLIIVGVGGNIDTYFPGTAPSIHPYLPDVRRPYFYDTKYSSSDPDDIKFWIGACTTSYKEGD